MTPVDWSGMRYPRVAVRHRCSRAVPGIMLTGTTTGPWGASTGLGQRSVGNTHANHVPGSLAWNRAFGTGSPSGKSRGGTPMGERAWQGARCTGRCSLYRVRRRSVILSSSSYIRGSKL